LFRKWKLKRFRKIINTLIRHGLGQIVYELGIDDFSRRLPFPRRQKEIKEIEKLSTAVRIRKVLEELGPTFIKFGQLLSTRSDIVPAEYLHELKKLQENVPPFAFDDVKQTIEGELDHDLGTLFSYFDPTPLAAASIGQVHKAFLVSGEKVAVKIQRPGIRKIIEEDLSILEEIAVLSEKYSELGKMYNARGVVEEFKHMISMELNYHHEGKNAERIGKNFHEDETVIIPTIYWNYSTQKVLTMQFVDGIKLKDRDSLEEGGYNTREIIERLAHIYIKQIFMDGSYHGDPHPGNVGVTPEGQIFFLDFGIAGHLNEEQKVLFNKMLLGLLSRNTEQVIHGITSLGIVTEFTDKRLLHYDLERLQERYYDLPLKDLNLGVMLHELMEVAFKHRIRLPPDFTMLAKTFLTLEGLASDLEPDFSIAELVEPMGKELLRQQLSMRRLSNQLYKFSTRYMRLAEILPERLVTLLDKGAEGNIKVKVEVSDEEHILNRFSHMVNRLSFSIVLASIILAFALMLQYTEVTLFRRFPLAEIGLVMAGVMGFWWLWAIFRSGRL